jgi:uncharacterized cysteine cluster protein YcgN (CxxCxxCC family)
MEQPAFLQKPMAKMSAAEWESLCDGCGLCCQIRLEDEDSGEIVLSNAACRYLCHNSHQCTDYANRQANVPDCVKVTPENVAALDWLPHTCGYRLVAQGHDLPDWHHLICGERAEVHRSGPSMKGAIISEDEAEFE